MNNKPTPETDAELNLYFRHGEAHQVSVAWIEFARKLERERDEARILFCLTLTKKQQTAGERPLDGRKQNDDN